MQVTKARAQYRKLRAGAAAIAAAPRGPESLLYAIGKKPVYLPEHVITLLHDPKLPASRAKFHVPLTFSKFDLHDYLIHGYGVQTTDIRSWVVQQPIRRKRPTVGDFQVSLAKNSGYYRPPANKYMIVEMKQPFVWPRLPHKTEKELKWVTKPEVVDGKIVKRRVQEEVEVETEDLEPWGRKVKPDDNPTKEREEEIESQKFRKTIREQAQELLSGQKKWRPTWMDLAQK